MKERNYHSPFSGVTCQPKKKKKLQLVKVTKGTCKKNHFRGVSNSISKRSFTCENLNSMNHDTAYFSKNRTEK